MWQPKPVRFSGQPAGPPRRFSRLRTFRNRSHATEFPPILSLLRFLTSGRIAEKNS
jgi:hypothetical protein